MNFKQMAQERTEQAARQYADMAREAAEAESARTGVPIWDLCVVVSPLGKVAAVVRLDNDNGDECELIEDDECEDVTFESRLSSVKGKPTQTTKVVLPQAIVATWADYQAAVKGYESAQAAARKRTQERNERTLAYHRRIVAALEAKGCVEGSYGRNGFLFSVYSDGRSSLSIPLDTVAFLLGVEPDEEG